MSCIRTKYEIYLVKNNINSVFFYYTESLIDGRVRSMTRTRLTFFLKTRTRKLIDFDSTVWLESVIQKKFHLLLYTKPQLIRLHFPCHNFRSN
jgi:hypothetical protein